MNHLNVLIAKNLKDHRAQNKLSLDKVAAMTGVSKSMLGQIERGETNPTVSIVWKIANGLKVPFTDLISEESKRVQVIKSKEVEAILSEDGAYKAVPYFSHMDNKSLEIYGVEMSVASEHTSDPHQIDLEEYVVVYQGELTILVGEEHFVLKSGDAMRFKGDKPHTYINSGSVVMIANMTLFYN